MAGLWHKHDAGSFTLEVPPGWVAEQPNSGTLLLQDGQGEISFALVAVSKSVFPGMTKLQSPRQATPVEAQTELQKWIETQKHVQVRQPPRQVPGARFPMATTEGVQEISERRRWYHRIMRRPVPLLWRYWAILNPYLLILASCNGKAAAIERERQAIDRLIMSIRLPEHDILFGRRFTETVVSLARSWFPQTQVAVIDDVHLQFGSQNVSLVSLHRRYLASPDELPTQVRAFLTAVDSDSPSSGALGTWDHARDRVLPVFLTGENRRPAGRVLEEWVNGLWIGFVVQDERAKGEGAGASEKALTRADVQRWNVTPDDVHQQALHNLMAYSQEQIMEGRKSGGYTMLCLARPDRHNAARLLLPELHRKLREHLGNTFYAAIPTRDVLLAFNMASGDVVEDVREQVARECERGRQKGEGSLSPRLFLVTPDGIAGEVGEGEEDGS